MLYTDVSMLVGMTYVYCPFMILPLYANLVKMDFRLLEAARDLDANPWKAFWLITVPISRSGIMAGSVRVFIPSGGEFVIPSLLGGAEDIMIGRVVWDLGCRPLQVFFLVTLPSIAPALVSAWLLTFTLSVDDVVISEFLSGPGVTTLPQVIFSCARRGVNPSIYAAATILIGVVSLGIISYSVYVRRRQRRLAREISAATRLEPAFPDPVVAR